MDVYKKLKKQNGERFAQTLRNHHTGLLEILNIEAIVRHAGRDAAPLLPYLRGLLPANDNFAPEPKTLDPFVLLEQAGYDAFYADTLGKQNSIKHYYAPGELLCTFNDAARFGKYHIIHAIKKDLKSIRRGDFRGNEKRQDAYGTSVISIQILKSGGFISIKNRYNSKVDACDQTFDSNPDNVIDGLSAALKHHFNVDFTAKKIALPAGFVLMKGQIFKYHTERNNIYYGDQTWAVNGQVHTVDKGAGDALFDGFLFDNKTKTLKKIDPATKDSFADDFNRDYGDNRRLNVVSGNLVLDNEILIKAEGSRITNLYLPALTQMSEDCLNHSPLLTSCSMPALTRMGTNCLSRTPHLIYFSATSLISIGNFSLSNIVLTALDLPSLITMGGNCLANAPELKKFNAPALKTMGESCLENAPLLTELNLPSLTFMGAYCIRNAYSLISFDATSLLKMGMRCLERVKLCRHLRQRL